MDWILEHIQFVIAIAGALAWWLNQRKQAEEGEEAPPSSREATFDDPELAERTRRIREEIQRKIEQRVRGYLHEQPKLPRSEPPPVIQEVTGLPSSVVRQDSSQAAQRSAEMLEEQTALAEKLREAQLIKAAAQERVEFETSIADHSVTARIQTRTMVLDDLLAPEALRRAFILREVLGPPVALRR